MFLADINSGGEYKFEIYTRELLLTDVFFLKIISWSLYINKAKRNSKMTIEKNPPSGLLYFSFPL